MDGPAHPLSLKVMRVSRPGLANAWQPFYSTSPSFSAHSTASVTSLQGKVPLPGHPKTLRDLTDPTELLTLPAAFGAIQLGETFSSCLCINNEAHVDVEAVSLKVEMQTAATKNTLAEFGSRDHKLAAGDTDECLISHEIKELGQHVLACEVTYRSPQGMRQSSDGEHKEDPTLQTFRKFYKFVVTNPLSVKTKVHVPKSPSALLNLEERDTVFLEIHIQNMTQDPMHFEKIHLECAEGWNVEDPNVASSSQSGMALDIFGGSMTLMQPHDVRQYIYIMKPKTQSVLPPTHAPGSSIPLGRLNILWRSAFGEPGRLLTSMLSRRIPLPPAPTQQPVSAVPPYLKRNPPSRPQSPQLGGSRPNSPRPQSGIGAVPASLVQPATLPVSNIDVNLLLREALPRPVRIDVPLTIQFRLVVSAPAPQDPEAPERTIKLAVQHLQSPKVVVAPALPAPILPQTQDVYSPQPLSSGFSTPVSTVPTFNYDLARHKLLMASTTRIQQERASAEEKDQVDNESDFILYPPPHPNSTDELKGNYTGVTFLGSSATILPPIKLSSKKAVGDTIFTIQPFELTFLPLQKGYQAIGGLRVLLLDDKLDSASGETTERRRVPVQARILKEWDTISEVLVAA